MNFKYTANTLKKMEQLFEAGFYKVRYEKGHFNSGFCILEDKKIVVINKFLDVESRIQALIDILPQLNIQVENLDGEMQKWFQHLTNNSSHDLSIQTKMNLSE